MGHMKGLHAITFLLMVIGGLNWLILAIFNWDVGELFGGQMATVSKIIYILVGLSAAYELLTHGRRCRECKPDADMWRPAI